MSLVPTIYSSADPSAPQLTGQVGSFLSLIRAILINGYGSGGTAKAALGWTEPYSGTNKAVFRGNTTSGTGYRIRVDDSNAQYALLRGYETMTDVDTGAQPVPTVAQFANGTLWPKSAAASATARAWWAIGNELCLYLFVDAQGLGLAFAVPYFLGDIKSIRAGDLHHLMISTGALTAYTGTNSNFHSSLFYADSSATGWSIGTTYAGHLGRAHTQTPNAIPAYNPRVESQISNIGGPWGCSNYQSYPNPSNNGLLYSKGVVLEGAGLPRGFMPGLIVPFHSQPFSDLSLLPDIEGLPPGTILQAKSFRTMGSTFAANSGQVLFDTTNAW